MSTQLYSSRIGLRQPEPPEGRFAFPLGSQAGGGGGFTFGAAGTDVFTFTSLSIGGQLKPSGILSMWIDATQISAGTGTAKNLKIQLQNQLIVVPLGSQGYIIVTSEMPFTLTATIDGTLQNPGTANVILYNYNVFYTGSTYAGRTSPVGVPTATSPAAPSAGSFPGSVGSGGGGRGRGGPVL